MKEAIILGAINSEGKLTAYFTEEYHKLLDQNRGRRIVMTISIMSENATISQKTYYDKVVLPSLQKCFNETGDDMTTKDTHEQALQMCPAIKDYNPDRELTRDEYKGLIDWAQRFCANEFAYQIPGPFTEIDEIKINSLTKKQTP